MIAPFVVLEVAIERGDYPAGHEPWAWALAAVFGAGAIAFFAVARRGFDGRAAPAVGLVAVTFDLAVVSGYVAVYSFEPGSPVRQLLFLPVVEAALLYGRAGGLVAPLFSVPALAAFEREVSDRLAVAFDPGHVIFPVGLQILVGLIVGSLVDGRLRT